MKGTKVTFFPGSVPLYRRVNVAAGIYEDPLIRPEHVHDLELGASWRTPTLALSANAYRMDFRDELVFAGQFDTDLGYAILGNAARSVHQGVELSAAASRRSAGGLEVGVDLNATLSDNHFVEFRESFGPTPADQVVYDDKPIGFSPAIMANSAVHAAWRGLAARLEAQHAGRVYVDNTGTAANSVAPHTAWNAALSLTRPVAGTPVTALLRGLNLGDLRYAATATWCRTSCRRRHAAGRRKCAWSSSRQNEDRDGPTPGTSVAGPSRVRRAC